MRQTIHYNSGEKDMSMLLVTYDNKIYNIECEKGTLLFEALRKEGVAPASPCGGRGTCGKCAVFVTDASGTRKVLACRTYVDGDMNVTVPTDRGDVTWNETLPACEDYGALAPGREGLGLAVDLGTTTVAVKLYDLQSGKLLGTKSEWNAQKDFGADVITRIQYCKDNADGLEVLSDEIRRQIRKMAGFLCMKKSREPGDIKEICICGNTVMQHIFAGLSPVSIASAPYEALSLFDDGKSMNYVGAKTFLAPCVAGYVGGDITSGLLSSGLWKKPGRNLFIDVGTNGEMALGGRDGFVSCAVASGPAFEGAGIACGMQALDGAINKAKVEDGKLVLEIVGGGKAKGICGSGLLDLISCLLKLGAVNKRGKFDPASDLVRGKGAEARVDLTEDGSVYLCQKDIRQLQLAKAAVAAGIKVLLAEEGLEVSELDGLYLAGGFGNRLDPVSAAEIGMLPMELVKPSDGSETKVRTVGNSALAGAEDALLDPSLRDRLIEIKDKCRYIELSTSSSFSEEFINELNF